MEAPLDPVISELSRIAATAESERAAADQQIIAELRDEIKQLRALVAQLRGSNAPVPQHLQPVAARAHAHDRPEATHRLALG